MKITEKVDDKGKKHFYVSYTEAEKAEIKKKADEAWKKFHDLLKKPDESKPEAGK